MSFNHAEFAAWKKITRREVFRTRMAKVANITPTTLLLHGQETHMHADAGHPGWSNDRNSWR